MALTKTDTAESQFRVSVAVAGVRRFVLTLLSALLVGCGGGGSDSGADTAAPQAAPLQEQILVFTQAGPLNLVVGDTLSNVASGGLGTGVIRYSSSDTTVATVDATGRLTVVGAGIATITAKKAADTQYAAASADYDVSATPVPQDPGPEPQRIGFDQPGPFNLVVGDTLSNVASGGLGTGVISYSSSNTTVATVDAAGRLTVVGAGIAMITAEKAADTQYAAASAGYVVSATPPAIQPPAVQYIGFAQPGPFNLVVGDTLSNVASGGSGTGVISYSSSNTTVATVDAAGQLTVVGAGIAMITAEKAADTQYRAASASYLVQTTQASQAIGFDQPGPLYLMVGDTLSNVASGGLGTGVIGYSSSNTTVATVDAAGQLTVVGIGTATITAEKAADRQYAAASASYTVTAPSRVPVTAWVGRENAQVDLPSSAIGMSFFRSTEANCDLSNVTNCANGQWNRVIDGETVEDSAFTLNQSAHYVLQHGANQASLAVSTERFSRRNVHQVVTYNNRLWVIGGWDGGAVKNDVWWSENGKTWIEVPPEERGSEHFSPRSHHRVAVYDDKLWLIGGWDGSTRNNDVWWSQDGKTWTEVPPEERGSEHFSSRAEHQVVTYNNRLWVIGGSDDGVRKNDVWWSQDGKTWTEVPPEERGSEHFSPRHQHQVVAHNDRLWLIGGWDGANYNDVWWSQDGKKWTEVPPEERGSEHFSPRETHLVVAHNNRLWLIGGFDGGPKNDVWWSEDGKTWTEVEKATNSAKFSSRNYHQVVAHNNRLWVIGGWDGGAVKNDVWWSEDGATWTEAMNNADFSPRHSPTVVAHNNRLWVIGGNDGAFKNDVWWSQDGATWTEVPPEERGSEHFSARSSHQVVVYDDQLWLIGGLADDGYKNDVWRSEDGVTWHKVETNNDKFSERSDHQVALYDDKLWVIGGWNGTDYYDDVWRSEDGKDWTKVDQPTDSDKLFSERSHHQVAVYDDKLWVIGGWVGGNARKNDVWWSQDGKDWTKVDQPTDSDKLFSERSHHEVAVHNNRLWLVGGFDGGARQNDVWWSQDGKDWTEVTGSADFSPRNAHRVVAHNDRLWVIGGWDGARKNDVWRSEDGENWRLGFHHVFQFQ